MLLKSLCYDVALADLLHGHMNGKVMGVYQNSFHLLLRDGRLVTVFGSIENKMPMSICTTASEVFPFRNIWLKPGMNAVISDGVLTIAEADFECELGGVSKDFHRSRLPVPRDIDIFESTLRKAAKQNGAGEFLPHWLAFWQRQTPVPMQAVIPNRIIALLHAVENGPEAITRTLLNSVGLGIGLTPSADDMICGVATACWLYWPEPHRSRFLNALQDFCRNWGKERTTLLSCQQILQTSMGILSEPVYQLARSLNTDCEDFIAESTAAVIDYGNSSGTELCMGFLAGLYFLGSERVTNRPEL